MCRGGCCKITVSYCFDVFVTTSEVSSTQWVYFQGIAIYKSLLGFFSIKRYIEASRPDDDICVKETFYFLIFIECNYKIISALKFLYEKSKKRLDIFKKIICIFMLFVVSRSFSLIHWYLILNYLNNFYAFTFNYLCIFIDKR